MQLDRLQRTDQRTAELYGLIAAAHQTASGGRDSTGRGTWSGSGFGSAGDRRSGADGQHVSLCGQTHFLGEDLSRKRTEYRTDEE